MLNVFDFALWKSSEVSFTRSLNYGINTLFHPANLETAVAPEESLIACTSYHIYTTQWITKVYVDSTDIDEFINDSMSVEDVSNEFLEFATIIMNHLSLQKPRNAKEGLDHYILPQQEVDKLSW